MAISGAQTETVKCVGMALPTLEHLALWLLAFSTLQISVCNAIQTPPHLVFARYQNKHHVRKLSGNA